jgi:hypothetical protein
VKSYNSEGVANALMSYVGNFGLFDELMSDPGSDLMSSAVAELNSWLGLRHKVSLVDVHTSNGCENTNKMVIQHISALVNDLRIKEKWSDPKIISLIQFHFNSSLSSEAGVEPFHALFGSADKTYYQIADHLEPGQYQTAYVKLLDETLRKLRIITAVDKTLLVNQFAVGDLV